MDDDLRFAARFTFLEELWRGRPRLIVDPGLEAYLGAGVGGDDEASEPLRDLVDRLLPAGAGPRTWMATHEEATGRELARTRPATGFVGIDMLMEVLEHREWSVALVDFSGLIAGPGVGEGGASGEVTLARSADHLPPVAVRLLDKLGAAAQAGRAVAVVLPAAADDDDRRGFDDLAAVEILADTLGGGRLYGLYRPPMAGIVDYGGDVEDVHAGDEDVTMQLEDEDVELSFDNTLGTQKPRVIEWVLVAGARGLPDGLTLLELPPLAAVDPLPSTLRARLAQAQRHADLEAIEAHVLAERLDDLSRENDALRARVAELADELARTVQAAQPAPAPVADDGARLEEATAQVHALKWQVGQLEDQLEAAIARPVDALEAEVAELRARLAAAMESPATVATAGRPRPRPESSSPAADPLDGALDTPAKKHGVLPGVGPAPGTLAGPALPGPARGPGLNPGLNPVLDQIDALLGRLERGGLPNVRLRDTLLQLRGQLRRHVQGHVQGHVPVQGQGQGQGH
jgi:hypothetical protein